MHFDHCQSFVQPFCSCIQQSNTFNKAQYPADRDVIRVTRFHKTFVHTVSLGYVKPKIMLLHATSDRGCGKRKKEKLTRLVTFLIFPYHQTSFLRYHICITMGIQNEQTYYYFKAKMKLLYSWAIVKMF